MDRFICICSLKLSFFRSANALFSLFFLTSPAPTFWPSSPAGPWCSAVLWRCPARVGWAGWAWRHGTWCAPPASRGPCTVWRKALVAGARTPHHWRAIRSGAPAWVPRWWPSWACRSGAKAHSNSTSKVSQVQIRISVVSPPYFSNVELNPLIHLGIYFLLRFRSCKFNSRALKNTWSPLRIKKYVNHLVPKRDFASTSIVLYFLSRYRIMHSTSWAFSRHD